MEEAGGKSLRNVLHRCQIWKDANVIAYSSFGHREERTDKDLRQGGEGRMGVIQVKRW